MQYILFTTQILLSTLLGGLVGWPRERIGKAAGLRTYALVAMGATLFTILSREGFGQFGDPRVAAEIVIGIGFLGAGTIIHRRGSIDGLTTAAGLWAMAAVGMTIGIGWFVQSVIVTAIMLGVFLFQDKKLFSN